jgi:hypothetical protein
LRPDRLAMQNARAAREGGVLIRDAVIAIATREV